MSTKNNDPAPRRPGEPPAAWVKTQGCRPRPADDETPVVIVERAVVRAQRGTIAIATSRRGPTLFGRLTIGPTRDVFLGVGTITLLVRELEALKAELLAHQEQQASKQEAP